MPLHPKAKKYLDDLNAQNLPPKRTLPISEVRRMSLARAALIKTKTEVGTIVDCSIPGPAGELPIRVYTPHASGPFPLIVYFHGGGWASGNLDTHDEVCRKLCTVTGSVVASIDYRLAPEWKFPAAVDDAAAATKWACEHAVELQANPQRIVVAGDSSGGNLAAVVALRFRDEQEPPLAGQVLYYPVTDYYEPGTRSYEAFREGYALASADMKWFWDLYVGDKTTGVHPYASPLRAKTLQNLPPALIITAENDPLADEGRAYALRLEEAGVPTQYSCYGGTIHGFLIVPDLADDADRAIAETQRWLAERSATE